MLIPIDIQSRHFPLTDALRNHVRQRLSFIDKARYDRVNRAQVHLSDVSGPHGVGDKCCLIRIPVPGQADVVIEETRPDLYAAINRASARTARVLTRKLRRQRLKTRGKAGVARDRLFDHGLPEPSFS